MAANGPLTPARRDALLAVAALGLLVAPLWVPALHLDDPRYRYESVAIETDGARMAFATEPEDPLLGISERIACAGERWGRACVFEHAVAANRTVPTRIYASQERAFRDDVFDHRYRFVHVNGTVYEVGAVANTSAPGHGRFRLDLAHRPIEADRALDFVSVDAEDVPPPIQRAARTGSATGVVKAVPDTPVELEDGSYRRVYVANATYPPDHTEGSESLLTFGLPVAGLVVLGRSWSRFVVDVSVRYTPGE